MGGLELLSDERIEKLEERQRLLFGVVAFEGIFLIGCLAVLCFVSRQPHSITTNSITTKRLTIVDDQDKTRALLGWNELIGEDDITQIFYAPNGAERLRIVALPDSTLFRITSGVSDRKADMKTLLERLKGEKHPGFTITATHYDNAENKIVLSLIDQNRQKRIVAGIVECEPACLIMDDEGQPLTDLPR